MGIPRIPGPEGLNRPITITITITIRIRNTPPRGSDMRATRRGGGHYLHCLPGGRVRTLLRYE